MSEVVNHAPAPRAKRDADYVFYELTRSICPECRRVIDAQIILRDNKVYMRKRCPEHGPFEALVYGDAQAYTPSARFNKPGTIPLEFSTEHRARLPARLRPVPRPPAAHLPGHHRGQQRLQHGLPAVLRQRRPGLQPDAGGGRSDARSTSSRTEGNPEVVQFSGGEPSIHPQIIPMLRAAKTRNIRYVMINTNGKRIAA